MASLFTKILDGQIPGQVVHQDEVCAAILDIMPLTRGHVVLFPREEVDHWIDVDGPTRDHLFEVAATIGRAQLSAFGGERTGLIIQGFEVPHAHLHVFPTKDAKDFDLTDREQTDTEELATVAEQLRAALA
ncbi:HIT family protein [Ornithinimicrobium sp. Y1847]|uniref:HIT family protein n=1 Tax=unclassified Ornithinimicrobium TaxID=2615080 RepID=UPI003B677925